MIRKILHIAIVLLCFQTINAQEQPQIDDGADSIYLKCLYEHKSLHR
jgi:hypothetical protein